MDSTTILFHPTRSDSAAEIRLSLRLLERVRQGWCPPHDMLASVRHAERWTVNRSADALVYQFVGHRTWPTDQSSLIIGTALAISPRHDWALLAGNSWITLGPALPHMRPFDPADVMRSAEIWLQAQRS
jgi:hypothetical protein